MDGSAEGELVQNDEKNYTNEDGVYIVRLPIKGGRHIHYRFKRYENLIESIQKLNPEILFIHGLSFLDISIIADFLKDHREIITYIDNHADFSNSATNWLSKNILHKMIWKYYAHKIEPYTKKFYGVLPARVDFLREVYDLPMEKCEFLSMGSDDELVEEAAKPEIRAKIRKKYGIQEDDFLIMTGGKIDQWKTQILLLMEAVQNVKETKVKLIVFGSVVSELKARVNALADGKKVQYIGWIGAKETYYFFSAADLVVFPGRHSVFWEQVAGQGIPMLVKDWPGTHHVDLGGNVGFLYRDDVNEMQEYIMKLINDSKLYETMAKCALDKRKKKFSYNYIAQKGIEQE